MSFIRFELRNRVVSEFVELAVGISSPVDVDDGEYGLILFSKSLISFQFNERIVKLTQHKVLVRLVVAKDSAREKKVEWFIWRKKNNNNNVRLMMMNKEKELMSVWMVMMMKVTGRYSCWLLVKKVRLLDDRDDSLMNYQWEFVMMMLNHVTMNDNVDS